MCFTQSQCFSAMGVNVTSILWDLITKIIGSLLGGIASWSTEWLLGRAARSSGTTWSLVPVIDLAHWYQIFFPTAPTPDMELVCDLSQTDIGFINVPVTMLLDRICPRCNLRHRSRLCAAGHGLWAGYDCPPVPKRTSAPRQEDIVTGQVRQSGSFDSDLLLINNLLASDPSRSFASPLQSRRNWTGQVNLHKWTDGGLS